MGTNSISMRPRVLLAFAGTLALFLTVLLLLLGKSTGGTGLDVTDQCPDPDTAPARLALTELRRIAVSPAPVGLVGIGGWVSDSLLLVFPDRLVLHTDGIEAPLPVPTSYRSYRLTAVASTTIWLVSYLSGDARLLAYSRSRLQGELDCGLALQVLTDLRSSFRAFRLWNMETETHCSGVVAAVWRVPESIGHAVAVEIQAGGTRDQDALSVRSPVMDALEPVAPAAVLVDLIEGPEPTRGELTPEDPLAVLGDVPAQVPLRPAG